MWLLSLVIIVNGGNEATSEFSHSRPVSTDTTHAEEPSILVELSKF